MTRLRRTFALLTTLLLIAALATGCDPKSITSSEGPGGGTGGDDDPPQGVEASAAALGSVVALYADLLKGALSQSASFDGGSAARSIFTSACMTIEPVLATQIEIRIDGCTDANGTEYQGKVALMEPPPDPPERDFDGYYMWPYEDPAERIIATNESNSELNHTYESGSLQIHFQRNGSTVNAVEIKSFVSHMLKTRSCSFQYVGVFYDGGVGSHADYPRSGGIIQVAWDSVGVFDVEFSGGAAATFSLQGFSFRIDLANGTVSRTL